MHLFISFDDVYLANQDDITSGSWNAGTLNADDRRFDADSKPQGSRKTANQSSCTQLYFRTYEYVIRRRWT